MQQPLDIVPGLVCVRVCFSLSGQRVHQNSKYRLCDCSKTPPSTSIAPVPQGYSLNSPGRHRAVSCDTHITSRKKPSQPPARQYIHCSLVYTLFLSTVTQTSRETMKRLLLACKWGGFAHGASHRSVSTAGLLRRQVLHTQTQVHSVKKRYMMLYRSHYGAFQCFFPLTSVCLCLFNICKVVWDLFCGMKKGFLNRWDAKDHARDSIQ